LSRAASILRALRFDNRGLSLGQLATSVDLPRSTVQRIVNALIDEGMIVSGHNHSGYRLGPEILLLANAMRKDITQLLHPMLASLAIDTGETVDLALMRNTNMVFIDQVVGTQRLRTVSAIGDTFPMTITANGKAALALLEVETVKNIATAERATKTLSKSLKTLKQELDDVRQDGYALDIDEHTKGISAAGIAFVTGNAVYAISVPAPTSRFLEKKNTLLAELLSLKDQLAFDCKCSAVQKVGAIHSSVVYGCATPDCVGFVLKAPLNRKNIAQNRHLMMKSYVHLLKSYLLQFLESFTLREQ